MTVKKTKGGYALFSKTTGRRLSKVVKSKNSPSLKKREKQIQFFKNNDKYERDHPGKTLRRRKKG
jgi:hypothetical protein